MARPKARHEDGRTNTVMAVRIRPENLMRLKELATARELSQAAMAGELIESALDREKAAA